MLQSLANETQDLFSMTSLEATVASLVIQGLYHHKLLAASTTTTTIDPLRFDAAGRARRRHGMEDLHEIEEEDSGGVGGGGGGGTTTKQGTSQSVQLLQLAAEIELTQIGTPSYEPPLYPPAYETFAEVLIQQGRNVAAYGALNDSVLFAATPEEAHPDSKATFCVRDFNRAAAVFLRGLAASNIAESASQNGQTAASARYEQLARQLLTLFVQLWSSADAFDHQGVACGTEPGVCTFVSPFVTDRLQTTRTWLTAHTPTCPTDDDSSNLKMWKTLALAAFAVLVGVLFVMIFMCCANGKPKSAAHAKREREREFLLNNSQNHIQAVL